MNGFSWFLATLWSWSAEALLLAVQAAASAALLAAVVGAVNLFCRQWFSARQMGLLWGVVLLRLLLPVAPTSFFSLQKLLPSLASETTEPNDLAIDPGVGYGTPYEQQYDASFASPGDSTAAPLDAAGPVDDISWIEEWLYLSLPFVWSLGAATTLFATAIIHWRFCRRLRNAPASDDLRLCRLWNACRQMAGVQSNVPILLTDGVDQPAIAGTFRPKLLLPEHASELSDEQLRFVMLHELAHVRRWHIAVNWALLLVRSVHWWNPVYWLAAARFQSLREQACDAFAIERAEGCATRAYGDLLLTLAGRRPARVSWRIVLPVSMLGFFSAFFHKLAVRNRIRALRTAGITRGRWHTAGIVALIALAAACGLTDAGTPNVPPEPARDWLPRAVDNWNNCAGDPQIESGTTVTGTYDVAKALRRIADDAGTIDLARAQLKAEVDVLLMGFELNPGNFSMASKRPRRDEARVAIDGDTLKVDAAPGVHAEIERNLRAWEEGGLAQICVETRFITAAQDMASDLGVSWSYVDASSDDRDDAFSSVTPTGAPVARAKAAVFDYLPMSVAKLDAERARQLLDAAQRSRTANLLQAPKITLFNGQRASMFDRTQTPFVVGLKDVGKGGQEAKVAVVDEGIKLAVRATQNRAAQVQLEARVELSEINEVRTAKLLFGTEAKSIQLPRVKRCRIDAASELSDGESLLIGCAPTYEQERFFYVLLTVRKLGAGND